MEYFKAKYLFNNGELVQRIQNFKIAQQISQKLYTVINSIVNR